MTCLHDDGMSNLFCGRCGRVKDREALLSIKFAGAVGVQHSSSEAIRRFWATGDPTHFDNPKINKQPGTGSR